MVQNEQRDFAMHGDVQLVHLALLRLILNHPQHLHCRSFDGAYTPGAFTMWAQVADRLVQADPQALARHFQQTKMAD